MPKGDPGFGRNVKSPGRPKNPTGDDESLITKQLEADAFLQKNVMKYIKVQHDLALDEKKDPKVRLAAAQKLTDRAIGPVVEKREGKDNALVGLVRELIGLSPTRVQVIEGDFEAIPVMKELPDGKPS